MFGYGICLIISYLLQRNFTFSSTENKKNEFPKFLTVFAVAYLANVIVLALCIRTGVNKGLSQIIGGVFYIGCSFILNKCFVFQRQSTSP